jgi:hypothetical protein
MRGLELTGEESNVRENSFVDDDDDDGDNDDDDDDEWLTASKTKALSFFSPPPRARG